MRLEQYDRSTRQEIGREQLTRADMIAFWTLVGAGVSAWSLLFFAFGYAMGSGS